MDTVQAGVLSPHSLMLRYPSGSIGSIFSAEHQDNSAEVLTVPLGQSPQPLETKDIQEFLLAISDFLKSAELVSHGGKSK